jgi:hypothetical protein
VWSEKQKFSVVIIRTLQKGVVRLLRNKISRVSRPRQTYSREHVNCSRRDSSDQQTELVNTDTHFTKVTGKDPILALLLHYMMYI